MSIEWVGVTPGERLSYQNDRARLTFERRKRTIFGAYRPHFCCELWDSRLRENQCPPVDARPLCDEPICIIDVKPAVTLSGASWADLAENAMQAAGPWGTLLRIERLTPRQVVDTQPAKESQRQALEAAGVGDRDFLAGLGEAIGGAVKDLGDVVGDVAEAGGKAVGAVVGGALKGGWPLLLVGGVIVAGILVTQTQAFRKLVSPR